MFTALKERKAEKKSKKMMTEAHRMIQQKKDQFQQMEKDLQVFLNPKDDFVHGIVRFFDYMSKLHDENPFQDIVRFVQQNGLTNESFYKPIKELSLHFENAGRCSSGMNRTKRGEPVTADKVYLGDVFGLHTKTAEYWIQNKPRLQNDIHRAASKDSENNPVTTWMVIEDYQAKRFVTSHVKGMTEMLQQLQTIPEN